MSDVPRPEATEPGTGPGAPEPAPDDVSALGRLAAAGDVTVRVDGRDLVVMVDQSGSAQRSTPEEVAALLPRVRSVLADFAAVRERATAFLWEWGAEGEETEEERAGFHRDVLPGTLTLTVTDAREARFAVHFDSRNEAYLLDGYWPAVHLDADLHPDRVTIEA
ncbi:hypothetical protein ACH4E8_14520 [Streptomyces sp. NPDC017979]|uniref:hypothetical protein n=1 Tax=Streptomyces sp. NPDC017979 TaxID=3365024 RepID=UPI0037949CA5